jgi:hypothetical protein
MMIPLHKLMPLISFLVHVKILKMIIHKSLAYVADREWQGGNLGMLVRGMLMM